MSLVTLRPNAVYTQQGVTVFGAASINAALADNTDASGITMDIDYAVLEFDNFSFPSGAVTRDIAARVRGKKDVNNATLRTILLLNEGANPLMQSHYQMDTVFTLTSPSTVTIFTGIYDPVPDLPWTTTRVQNAMLQIFNVNNVFHLHELYLDVTYVLQPELTVDSPTGLVDETNQPIITWTPDLDSSGGGWTHYAVRVIADAVYLGGGFDPATSPAVDESGIVASSALSYQTGELLPDDTYRAYVATAQTVNGIQHWSEIEFIEFTVEVLVPEAPGLVLTPEPDDGRIRLDITRDNSPVVTDRLEIQRQYVPPNGSGIWTPVRTDEGDGFLTPTGVMTIYDYEAPNGATVNYRVRGARDYNGQFASSAWAEDSSSWTSTDRWLKHPTDPTANQVVDVWSYGEKQHPVYRGVHHVLGRKTPIVVFDSMGDSQGELQLWFDTQGVADFFGETFDGVPRLLQMLPGDREPDRWLALGDVAAKPAVDKHNAQASIWTVLWTEVLRP